MAIKESELWINSLSVSLGNAVRNEFVHKGVEITKELVIETVKKDGFAISSGFGKGRLMELCKFLKLNTDEVVFRGKPLIAKKSFIIGLDLASEKTIGRTSLSDLIMEALTARGFEVRCITVSDSENHEQHLFGN